MGVGRRARRLSPQEGTYNLSPAGFDYFKQNGKPGRASSVDCGIRTRHAGVEASLSTYYSDYRNRLVSVANWQLMGAISFERSR
jgi:hypothetical protein